MAVRVALISAAGCRCFCAFRRFSHVFRRQHSVASLYFCQLSAQAMHPDTHILWIVGMMLLHFVFSTFSGDWYFTGDYPTPGGYTTVNVAM